MIQFLKKSLESPKVTCEKNYMLNYCKIGAAELAQQVGVFVALVEDLGSVSSTYTVAPNRL